LLNATDSPIFCYVTDRKAFGAGTDATLRLMASVRRAVGADVDLIQIREKDLPGRDLIRLAREAVGAASATTTKIIVNDRLDVAVAARAGGVHLGGESLPVRAVFDWRKKNAKSLEFLIGASAHSLKEAQSVEQDGADYIIFGPVFETPSKASFGPPQGVERLGEVCSRIRIPVLAIGGVNGRNASDCIGAGAAGIAAIRMFQEAPSAGELKVTIERLRSLKRS